MTAHTKKRIEVSDDMRLDVLTSKLSAKQLRDKYQCGLNTIYLILRNPKQK